MIGALVLKTPPSSEVVTLSEFAAHAHVDYASASEADYVSSLLAAARLLYDGRDGLLSRALVTQTWLWYLDGFPSSSSLLTVPLAPLQSITSIKYLDADDVEQTWGASNYRVDTKTEPARVTLAVGASWPTTYDVPNAVTVEFVAGYGGPKDVPIGIKLLVLDTAAHWYQNREPTAAPGVVPSLLPMHLDQLLAAHRLATGIA